MTDRGPNPLNPLMSKLQQMQNKAEGPARWESSRVDFLLKALNLTYHRDTIRREDSERFLTFSAVNDTLGLPMSFGACPLYGKLPVHRDVKSVHPVWFKNFQKLPVAVVYFEMFREYILGQDIRPFGLVFPRKGFAQGMCVHNGSLNLYLSAGQGAHIFRSKEFDQDFYVQPYHVVVSGFKKALGKDYQDE